MTNRGRPQCRNLSLILCLPALVLCFCSAGAVMEAPRIDGPQTIVRGLSFHITTASTTVRLGAKLTIEGELINTGSERLAIDTRMLWYKSHFSSSRIKSNGGEIASMETIGDPGTEAPGLDVYLILDPGQSYKASTNFTLKNKFFRKPGRYTVRLTYGQFHEGSTGDVKLFSGAVSSNQISFDLTLCKNGCPK